MLYTTNKPCAKTPQAASNLIDYGTNGNQIAQLDIGSGAEGLTWYYVPHEKYTYRLKGYGTSMEQPGEYSTLCAILYDATGDPPQSLYPHGIKRNHVWKRAQARMGTGAPS